MMDIVPNNEAYLLPGGETGCLLLHGFSSMPEEMRPLGEYLARQGFSVFGARLSGHATYPEELNKTRWSDWMADVEDGLNVLKQTCKRRIVIGQSLGGMIALTAAGRMKMDGVVSLSTPYGTPASERLQDWLVRLLRRNIEKNVSRFPPDHPLYHRRELNYPAYPEFPTRILTEMDRLATAMLEALPKVKIAVLLIHSKADREVPFSCMQDIFEHLGSAQKEMLAVEGMDHSLVMDPQHQVVFEAVGNFIRKLEETSRDQDAYAI